MSIFRSAEEQKFCHRKFQRNRCLRFGPNEESSNSHEISFRVMSSPNSSHRASRSRRSFRTWFSDQSCKVKVRIFYLASSELASFEQISRRQFRLKAGFLCDALDGLSPLASSPVLGRDPEHALVLFDDRVTHPFGLFRRLDDKKKFHVVVVSKPGLEFH